MKAFKYIAGIIMLAATVSSCQKDLNRVPTNALTADKVYSTPEGYKQSLAKIYGAFALTGNGGPDAGEGDIAGIDQGTSDFLRLFWNLQELTTDEAAIVWNDPGLQDFHVMNWTSTNVMIRGLYSRCLYHITACNEFIRESTDEKIASRNISGAEAENIRRYRAEARFLRAFEYWVLMDLFGNPPFVTENDPIGKFTPPQTNRANLFNYIESELKAIEPELVAAKQNEYGRADQAAAQALLARIYLNAEVYLGSGNNKYNDAITYAEKVINSAYSLNTSYRSLFLGDNNVNNTETIFAINYDGVNSQTYGGTTYLINAAVSGAMGPATFGVPNGGWSGMRSTRNLPETFGDYSGNTDKRAMFAGNKIEMDDITIFTDGLAVAKFSNITSTGTTPPSPNGVYTSTDFPLFRLAEMYLVYAEAVKRGGTGSEATAIGYINLLRQRAYGNNSGNISTYTLNDVLNERTRELYWEGFRRSDLIRYGRFTGSSYLWPWKGGARNGRAVEAFRALFPLPSSDVNANPNLVQNQGY
ncbi:RagB/SusD family nutrient uptake outer membrane protein [Mucilaginibacter defluvii]|uniref:RagB/SusD family nutrient uptake outer membrane protein n=1 Tax=Mucilaginibacter defluvii TaxID=1196019 RepID=A0ABP9FRI7_9SPHI